MLAFLAAAWLGAPVSGGTAPAEPAECKVVLNGVERVLDGDTRAPSARVNVMRSESPSSAVRRWPPHSRKRPCRVD